MGKEWLSPHQEGQKKAAAPARTCQKHLSVLSPLMGAPSRRLCDGQLGLPALVVSAKLRAITTKPLDFLQTIFPFAIS